MTRKRKRVALNLNSRQLEKLGQFLFNCGLADQLGVDGRASYEYARQTWGTMDSVTRAAVGRLGLRPRLKYQGLIPDDV